jgi:hypothetical protein
MQLVHKTRVAKVDALATTTLGIDVAVEPAEEEEVAELGGEQVARS